jgi:hypothetical protein
MIMISGLVKLQRLLEARAVRYAPIG